MWGKNVRMALPYPGVHWYDTDVDIGSNVREHGVDCYVTRRVLIRPLDLRGLVYFR